MIHHIRYDKITSQIQKKEESVSAAASLLQAMLANLQQLRIAQKFSSQHEIDHLGVDGMLHPCHDEAPCVQTRRHSSARDDLPKLGVEFPWITESPRS